MHSPALYDVHAVHPVLFRKNRKEFDVQTQIELFVAKDGKTVAVLSPPGFVFQPGILDVPIRANRVRALYISFSNALLE